MFVCACVCISKYLYLFRLGASFLIKSFIWDAIGSTMHQYDKRVSLGFKVKWEETFLAS